MRGQPTMGTTEESPRRNLCRRIKLLTIFRKRAATLRCDAPRSGVSVLERRWPNASPAAPSKDRDDRLIGKAGKSSELLALDGERKSGVTAATKIRINPCHECVGSVHTCLPGHGKAT